MAPLNLCDHLLDRHVRDGRGARVAVVVEGRATTYADLALAAEGAAAGLRRLGLSPSDRVLLALFDGVEFAAAFLGAMRLGAVPVPVNPLLAGPDLAVVAGEARCSIAVLAAGRAEAIEGLTAAAPGVADIVLTGDEAGPSESEVRLHAWSEVMKGRAGPPHPIADDAAGFWLSTGATSGPPKLVVHRQSALRATAAREDLGIAPTDRIFGVAPMFHAYGLAFALGYPFSVGACAVVEPRRPPAPGPVADITATERPTVFYGVPTFYAALLASDVPDDAFASVRLAVSSGEPLAAAIRRRVRERFGVEVLDGVVSTEMAGVFLSEGQAVTGYELRLVDETGEPAPDGAPGRLWVRGPTAAADGWTRTDDLFVRDDRGRHTHVGRVDEVFTVSGELVSPVRVEGALLEHPAVAETAVVGRPGADGTLQVIAYVVEAPGVRVMEEELIAFSHDRLATWERPARVVVIDALPKTAIGKIRRSTLGTGTDLVQARRPQPAPTMRSSTGLCLTVLDGAEIEYEVRGRGEPLLLIHGSHVARSFLPLMVEPELVAHYTLIRYHRRGYLGSSAPAGPVSIDDQAGDARRLLEHLGIGVAHVAGHSYGATIALQLAVDAPELVGSLVLLEPWVNGTPAGAATADLVDFARERYRRGEWDAAEDLFLGGTAERASLARAVPGSVEQALRDMDTCFAVEAPALAAWRFTAAEGTRIRCPVLHMGAEHSPDLYHEIRDLLWQWMPQLEAVAVRDATHLLQMQQPGAVACAIHSFLGRHRLAAPVLHALPAPAPTAARPVRRPQRRERFNAAADLLDSNLDGGRAAQAALRTAAGDHSYAEVAARTNQAGLALRELGVREGDPVVLALPDSPALVAALLGAMKIGALPVPLSTSAAAEDYGSELEETRAAVAVVAPPVADVLRGIRTQVRHLRHVVVDGEPADAELALGALLDEAGQELSPADTTRDDPAFVLYGADDAGRAKGVVHLHGAMRACADAYGAGVLGLAPADVVLSTAKLHMGYGLGNGLYLPFAAGATSVLLAEPVMPRIARDALARYGVTVHFTTPGDLAGLLAAGPRREDLRALRFCVASGGPLPGALLKRFSDATGVEVLEGMGSIESGHIFISNRPGDVRPGSIGTLVEGYEARLVDEHGRDVPTGQPGRLLVRGESVFGSYWRNRALTATTLLGEWLRTGEVLSRDDSGRYFHHGRRDNMLVVGGMLVSPQEIEEVVREDEHVSDCVVVGVPDDDRLVRPEAFVVADVHDGLEDVLRQLVRRRLGGPKTPRAFHFVSTLPQVEPDSAGFAGRAQG